MQIAQAQYLMDTVFNKYTCDNGTVIYWRDCVLQADMIDGSQGYTWVYEDGNTFHSYRTPAQCFD